MALLPGDVFSLANLAIILVGLSVVAKRGVPKAYGLGVVMLVVFLVDTLSTLAGFGGTQRELGFVAARFFGGDAWWAPLTSVFSHAPPGGRVSIFQLHLIGNLLILITAGPALEDRIGEKRFLLVFFASAFAALVAHSILAYATPIVRPGDLALGASGGLFGILTAFAVRYPRERLPVILFFILWLPAFAVLLVYLGFNLVYMLTNTTIAWWGHFAGFLAGLGFAYTLPPGTSSWTPGTASAAKGLPDASRLESLASTPELRRILDRIRQFTPETRTNDDLAYAHAWLDKFFAKASCPGGHAFKREGLKATCSGGETTIDFARK